MKRKSLAVLFIFLFAGLAIFLTNCFNFSIKSLFKASLINPADNSQNVSTDPLLSWSIGNNTPEEDYNFDLFFSQGATPTDKILDNSSVTSFQVNSLNNGALYSWKVDIESSKGMKAEGDVWEFTTVELPPLEKPSTPVLQFPVNNSWENPESDILFTWTPSIDPDSEEILYDLYFSQDSEPTLFIQNLSNNHYSFAGNLSVSGLYYWKVRARNEEGEFTDSAVNKFWVTRLKWEFSQEGISFSGPAINDEGNIISVSSDGKAYCLDKSGNLLWQFNSGAPINGNCAVGYEGNIYFGNSEGDFFALSKEGIFLWHYTAESEILSSPVCGNDGNVYFVSRSGILYCFTGYGEKNGKQI